MVYSILQEYVSIVPTISLVNRLVFTPSKYKNKSHFFPKMSF